MDAFSKLRAQHATSGHQPSPATVVALFAGLAAANQGAAARTLLAELEAGGALAPSALAPAHNVIIRAVARQGAPLEVRMVAHCRHGARGRRCHAVAALTSRHLMQTASPVANV